MEKPIQAIPNLFIIGAMKCGTTSLHHYLDTHAQIFMCEPKEPGYFVEEINWNKGEQWYLSLFNGNETAARYYGESSTDYTKLPIHQGTAERINAFNPDARFIYLMRHPFERIVSHYWFAVRHISTGGLRQDIYSACMNDPQYLSYSNYPMQIRPYLDLFGRSRVRLLIFEDFQREPKVLIRSVLQWLDLEPEIDWDVLQTAYNARPRRIVGVSGLGLLNKLSYSNAWSQLSPKFPKSLKGYAKKLALRTIDPDEQRLHVDALYNQIRDDLRHQIEQMSEIMQRDLSEVWQM